MQYWVDGLAEDPLVAAAVFHAQVLPQIEAALVPACAGNDHSLVLIFAPCDHAHRAWRLAAVQSLARKYAPVRVNGIASLDEPAIAAAARYLDGASGVTGQYLPLDGNGAWNALS